MPIALDLGSILATTSGGESSSKLPYVKEVKEVANTVKAVVDAINAVKGLMGEAERSVVCEVANGTAGPLTLVSTSHDHGGFANPPDHSIPTLKPTVFGSRSSGFLTGAEGTATYQTADGTLFTIRWNNPFIGSNDCSAEWNGSNAGRYLAWSSCGNGNRGAQMRFGIQDRSVADFGAQPFAGVPSLVSSSYGSSSRNFELLIPHDHGNLGHYYRDNDILPHLPWIAPAVINSPPVAAVSMIQSNFQSPGNFEVVARIDNRLVFFFRNNFEWTGPIEIEADGFPISDVTGNPALIQSTFGRRGNFELVVPLLEGGLGLFFRDNDLPPEFPWHRVGVLGQGSYDAVTMIQSNFGDPGNLEVVARQGDRLVIAFRDQLGWKGPTPLVADGREATGASGNPVLLQSRFGKQGNFELVVPAVQGGIDHYFRDNDAPGLPWHGPFKFASGSVDALSMIQSNFGDPCNLELVARLGKRLAYGFRDSSSWKGPFFF